jgi:hypothetical protein
MNGIIDAVVYASPPGSGGTDDHAPLSTYDLYGATGDAEKLLETMRPRNVEHNSDRRYF